MAAKKWIRVTQVRSEISTPKKTQRETLRALGLTHRGKSVVVEDTPSVRGQIRAVCHLVEAVEEKEGRKEAAGGEEAGTGTGAGADAVAGAGTE